MPSDLGNPYIHSATALCDYHTKFMAWHKEIIPKQWREGLIVTLFRKGDMEDPGTYRGLLSVVGKSLLNIRLVKYRIAGTFRG